MGDPIDEFHDLTHREEFKKIVKNEDIRTVLNLIADAAQYLKNCASSSCDSGIYPFDYPETRANLQYALMKLKNDVVK